MLQTIQLGYEPMRAADVTVLDISLDGETAGYTFDKSDRPSDCWQMGPETNAVEIIFPVYDTSNNTKFRFKFWGYTPNGPAEFLCDISGTTGLARIDDSTVNLYADTITIAEQKHLKTISVVDNASDRIAKLIFDACGYKWIYAQCVSVVADSGVWPHARGF